MLNKSYSNIEIGKTGTHTKYHNLAISPITEARRKQVYLPKFTKFSWRGYDSFDNFGCFITSKQGDLKFYNGPTYSNQYTKPQFENASGNLTGVSFNTQKISFNIAVYWITEEHYRHFMDWLNPYVIDELSFDFDKNFFYLVKLAGVKDTPRQLVGYDENGEPAYYTEMTLDFEVQGESCAFGKMYEWQETPEIDTTKGEYSIQLKNESEINTPSLLSTPVNFDVEFANQYFNRSENVNIILSLAYTNDENDEVAEVELFNLILQNITIGPGIYTHLRYNSNDGIIFIKYGDSKEKILNLRYATTEGKKLVRTMSVKKYKIPGSFDAIDIDYTKLKFKLQVVGDSGSTEISPSIDYNHLINSYIITVYQRANLI